MSLLARLALVVVLLCAGCAALFWSAQRGVRTELAELRTRIARERAERLRIAAESQGRGLETLASSYAWWNDMVRFVDNPDPKWARTNLDNVVGIPGGGEAVWVLGPQLRLLHSIDRSYARVPLPFADPAAFTRLLAGRYSARFFTLVNGQLWEIFVAAIQDAHFWRHETPIRGYLLLGKKWDDAWLAQLNTLVGARLSLHDPGLAAAPPAFRWPIAGLDGTPLTHVEARFHVDEIEETRRAAERPLVLLAAAAIAALLLLLGFVAVTLLRPLGQLTRSLETRLTAPLAGLLPARSELGELARLVASQLRLGRMLQDEMHRHLERANPEMLRRDAVSHEALRLKLAGNLHDGPIQTIYAAGLQLAALHDDAERGRAATVAQVAAITHLLQQASSDLRNIILDLEPVELRDHDLDTALRRLELHFQKATRGTFQLDIPDALLDGFTREAQTQLYFVCRELTSNALRHARPTAASLQFSARSGFLRLDWTNDGVQPLTPAAASSGHGLRNIERRIAELGGTFEAGRQHDDQWRVVCEIPLTSLTRPPGAPPFGV